ncbi:MAG TPA: pseudouridine synthase [Bacillota bacterium]|mgnify:FL=1|nr:rRNA pseudouridine synthase [Bacillota bacterium]HOA15573.1 pseudouridine synthase [Bacillota bacterium]HOG52909.1 pseudouridine synthase [Bacillota bacterium]
MSGERIAKYIAACGIASRRKSEAFVTDGRVSINGTITTDMASKVMPGDVVALDGREIRPKKDHIYIMLNKPRGYLTTASDDRGRKTVMSLIDAKGHRVFPVGRLDLDSEGLLLLTDDGDLAYRLTHPGRNIDKTYFVSLSNPLLEEKLELLRIGIMIDGILTAPAQVEVVHPSGLMLEITIHEGRKRQVRRMVEAAGSRVLSLKRTSLGPLRLSSLKPGESRTLTETELGDLISLISSHERAVRND